MKYEFHIGSFESELIRRHLENFVPNDVWSPIGECNRIIREIEHGVEKDSFRYKKMVISPEASEYWKTKRIERQYKAEDGSAGFMIINLLTCGVSIGEGRTISSENCALGILPQTMNDKLIQAAERGARLKDFVAMPEMNFNPKIESIWNGNGKTTLIFETEFKDWKKERKEMRALARKLTKKHERKIARMEKDKAA